MIFIVKLSIGIVATSLIVPIVLEHMQLIAYTLETVSSLGL